MTREPDRYDERGRDTWPPSLDERAYLAEFHPRLVGVGQATPPLLSGVSPAGSPVEHHKEQAA